MSRILRSNPPDVPHYQKALEERKRRGRFWTLVIIFVGSLGTVISSSFGHPSIRAPQVKKESWQRVLSANQRFENYKDDFIQFGRSPQSRRSRNAEDLTDVQWVAVADHTVAHLEYIETIVAIYLKVSVKQDRLAIWSIIASQVDTTMKRLDREVQVTDALISVLKTPSVVNESMLMRDDLRRVERDVDGAIREIEAAEAKLP